MHLPPLKLTAQEVAKKLAERAATDEGKAALREAGKQSRARAGEMAERTRVDPTFLAQRVTY